MPIWVRFFFTLIFFFFFFFFSSSRGEGEKHERKMEFGFVREVRTRDFLFFFPYFSVTLKMNEERGPCVLHCSFFSFFSLTSHLVRKKEKKTLHEKSFFVSFSLEGKKKRSRRRGETGKKAKQAKKTRKNPPSLSHGKKRIEMKKVAVLRTNSKH